MNIKNTKSITEDFFKNRNVCIDPIELVINEECYVIDQNIVDNENGTYGIIPCIVVRIDESTRIAGRKYYMLQAHESKNDELLNHQEENGIKFYKYLENTSPFLIKVKEVIDR